MNELEVFSRETITEEDHKEKVELLIGGVMAFVRTNHENEEELDNMKLIVSTLANACFEYGRFYKEMEMKKCRTMN